ncbi:hypothetical protein ED343_22720 [Salmonella enterica]|nr:hypothetical protein [Salmonella enterica subsp. enterica serovar Litchfield]
MQRPTALLYGLRPAPPFGRCFSPLRPPLGGTSRPLSSGCGAGVAALLNPTPSRERWVTPWRQE